MEQMHYSLLFRWVADASAWGQSDISKNRDRLLEHMIIPLLFAKVVEVARKCNLLSDDHFSVDGTLIRAWASRKGFRPKNEEDDDSSDGSRNAERNFHGEKRSKKAHESKTDPDARSYRKSKHREAKLTYLGHSSIENRNVLVLNDNVWQANGYSEGETAIDLLADLPGEHRKTGGADTNYDAKDFVDQCKGIQVTPHAAQNTERAEGLAIDSRTTRHSGYEVSQQKRKRVEEPFGWDNAGPVS